MLCQLAAPDLTERINSGGWLLVSLPQTLGEDAADLIGSVLEADRGTEPTRRVQAKLDAYKHALAADPHRELGNVLLLCEGRRRLANLARCAPPGPPWVWGSIDGERYELLPAREQQRRFDELPAAPRQASRRVEDCLGQRWRRPAAVSV